MASVIDMTLLLALAGVLTFLIGRLLDYCSRGCRSKSQGDCLVHITPSVLEPHKKWGPLFKKCGTM